MTVDRSRIDEIFRERLKNDEVKPPYEVWEDIVVCMAERKKFRKRRMYMQIAASLIILVVAGTLFLTPFVNITDSGDEQNREESQTFSNMVEETPSRSLQVDDPEEALSPSETSGSALADDSSIQDSVEDFSPGSYSEPVGSLSSEETERTAEFLEEKQPMITGVASGNSMKDDLAVPEIYATNSVSNSRFVPTQDVELASEVPKTTHFSIKATMAPAMSYRRLQNNVSQVEYNTTESELFSYSGGVGFGYKLNNRLSVHSGFYYSQMGQTVNRIKLGSDDFARHDEEVFVRLKNSLGEVEVEPAKLLSAKPPENIQNIVNGNRLLKFSYKLDASVVQRFEYVKIPLMLEYTMIDKKIDVNLVGGLNSNFLVNEGVYLKNQMDGSRLIGNTTNIRQFNYSGALGLGLEYNFTQQINMYLEPHLDYFLNPINYHKTKTYPYSFGVHTGLSVTF
ncbi:MAG: outer membrane beta-barrel protein [Bacteroidales bacterium]